MGIKCPKCHFDNPDDTVYCGKCATPLPSSKEIPVTKTLETPTEELTTGSTFAGRYQIIEELGKGGMGKVYKALDADLKEKVAIKLIKPEVAADKNTIERFRNEMKFARKIRHKNVCQMYDLNKEEGIHYITMEYVHGEDLKRLIRKIGQMSAGQVISIAVQVCEGMAEAHRLGVVHRDLKPQNIMVDEEGNARIMDFGIARSVKGKGITGAGVMIGTPEYMSPEQVEGKEIDQRSDIYSLGVILYEMVTGQVPFEGDTPFTIGMKHKGEIPQNPKELNTQISDDLSNLILKCMEKDKEQRYQSAGEVRSELTSIEKGIPTTEREIPKRKPLTSKEITVTFRLKKLFIPALVVASLIIAAVIIWQLLPQKEVVHLAPSDKSSLAVMYFENNTGDEGLDHYRKAISDLLITDLAQSKHIRVVRGDRLFNILRQLNLIDAKSYSSEDLKEVASRGRATHILQGNYTKAGENFRINYMLHETATEELISSEMVEGKGEESIFSMVDELTRRIKANFKLSPQEIASDIDKQIGKITTSSPEAYKYYFEGRKNQDKGYFSKAIQFYKSAVAIDPEFATAYRSMAMAYSNLGYRAEERKCLQKSFELSDRVSDRERYRNQADFYIYSERTYDKAIDAYNKLLELYPEDWAGGNNLGRLYINLEEWDKAIERFEVYIQNKEETVYPYANQSIPYMAKGMNDKARDILEYYLNNFTDHVFIRYALALNYLCQGKYDLALVEVDKGLSLNPAFNYLFLIKGDICQYRTDFINAEREYQKLLEIEELTAHAWGRGRLAALNLLQGRFEKSKDQAKQGIELAKKLGEKARESFFHFLLAYTYQKSENLEAALEEYNKAWISAVEAESLSRQRFALYAKGLAYLDMKSMTEAQRVAHELKEIIEKGMNRKAIRYYHHLMGMIELEKEDFSKAIDYLNKALSLLPYQYSGSDDHALFIEPLASAYYKAGDFDKAREEYERITRLTTGRLYYGDIYARSFYMLGKIYEQKGNTAKAIEHYEKFLDLWKDADPGIAEVEDAKERLAGLKSQ